MYGEGIRIKRTGNGYTVSMRDPEIVKKNHEDKGPYRDPEVEFVFTDEKKLTAFVLKAIKKLDTGDEYDTAFSEALMEDVDE